MSIFLTPGIFFINTISARDITKIRSEFKGTETIAE